MSVKKLSSKFIKIKTNRGEKSKPPADGINFLIGARDLSEISSINCKKAFEFFGRTQLRITPPIILKNII